MIDWIMKEKLKIIKRSVFSFPFIFPKSVSKAQIKALKRDGEKPANHTKRIKVIILIKQVIFFLPIMFPRKIEIAENIERCIPDKARMWDKPAFLNARLVLSSVYSFAPDSKANKSPPPLPQAYISLLKCNLHKALKKSSLPVKFCGHLI